MADVRRQIFARKQTERDQECLSSTVLCEHCDDDKEVRWKCNDCSGEYCDRCRRIHLIADTGSQNHVVVRYGSTKTGSVGSFDRGSHGTGGVGSFDRGSHGTGSVGSFDRGSHGTGGVGSFDRGSHGTGNVGSFEHESHGTGSFGSFDHGSHGTGSVVSFDQGSNVCSIAISRSVDIPQSVSKNRGTVQTQYDRTHLNQIPQSQQHNDSDFMHQDSHNVPVIAGAIGSFECTFGTADNKTVQHIRVQEGIEESVWIKCGIMSDDIVLSSKEGRQLDVVKLHGPIEDFVVTWKGEILFTMYMKSAIWKHERNENIHKFADVLFKPSAICATKDRDILVASKNSVEHPIEKFTENALKVPFDPANVPGNLQTIYNITENINGDVLIAEKGGWGSGRLVALAANGQFKFKFQGQQGKLDPSSIACDKSGFIYVCGINCDNVFLLNMEGTFLSILIPGTYLLKNPESIVINDKGVVWIGEGGGVVKLFQLTY